MELLDQVAQWLTTPYAAFGVSALIALWALVAFGRFRGRLKPFFGEMRRLCALLESTATERDFASRFSEIDALASETEVMRYTWPEFKETLLYPSLASEDQSLLNPYGADAYFSRDNLLTERINLRLYNAVPNLLTGAGILGTFIGLVAGIHLASGNLANPDQAQEALGSLLGGASLAFLTSVAGLLSSIVFSWREKHWVHAFENLRQRWVSGLDKRLRRLTLERLGVESLEQSRTQTRVLQDFSEQLAFQLTAALEQTVPKALDEKVTGPLTSALQRVTDAVDQLARNQAKTNDDTLREIVERFSTSITAAAGTEMREFAESIKTMSTQLAGQVQAVADQQEAVRRQSQASVTQLADVFRQGAEGLQDKVRQSVDEILDGLSTTIGEMSGRLDAAMGRMSAHLDNTSDAFGRAVGELSGSVSEIGTILTGAKQLMAYLDQVTASARQANAALERTGASLGQTADALKTSAEAGGETARQLQNAVNTLGEGLESFAAIQGELTQGWTEYRQRFERLDESLGKTFGELEQGLQRFATSIHQFMTDLDTEVGRITNSLGGAVTELGDRIEDLTEAMARDEAR